MARISQYDQDSTLNKLDKVVGTDSATGATKNYTIHTFGKENTEFAKLQKYKKNRLLTFLTKMQESISKMAK